MNTERYRLEDWLLQMYCRWLTQPALREWCLDKYATGLSGALGKRGN